MCDAAQLHVEYPMLFQITNVRENRASHCGVLEFSGTEGQVFLPYWVSCSVLCALRAPSRVETARVEELELTRWSPSALR